MRQIGVQNVKLSEYEMSIAAHLVDPLTMHVSNLVSIWQLVVIYLYFLSYFINFSICKLYKIIHVHPQISWRDIAGLDEIITELKDTVILPVQKRYLFEGSRLLQPPKGKKW